jgi:hypothetical protein
MSHRFCFIRRLIRALTIFVVLAFILLTLFHNDLKRTVVDPPEIRALGHPSFADIREYERQFTQHTLPSRGGVRPRSVFFNVPFFTPIMKPWLDTDIY